MGKYIDLIGQRFERLLVLEDLGIRVAKNGHHDRYWKCQCDCGNIVEVKTGRLRNGNTKSCGCLSRDLTRERNLKNGEVQIGTRFGKLIVIKDLGLRKQVSRDKQWRWSLCQCDCGNIIEVPNNLLRNGQTKSCGCLNSYGEFMIEKLLKENNYNYIKQYKFPDLHGQRGGLLRFDFAVFSNNDLLFLIEYDGRQHYTGPEAKWSESYDLVEIQLNDKVKNDYCNEHNYLLKRIPYTETIITIDDLLSEKYNYKS